KLTPELAKSFGVNIDDGILVSQIMPKSPAEIAGLKTGDLILGVDGKPLKDPRQLQSLIAETDIGKTLEMSIVREKEKRTLKIKVGEMPGS
ncbi:MAG TPA: PDZ domain-containing protein, partial [Candidatus Methylomirabilis sp.]|nr:PDZ domain-containing protein [Candidatus Methylomirabilis sp.]